MKQMEQVDTKPEMLELKKKMKATWEAGDFGEIARSLVSGAEAFIQRLKLQPGSKVLDVACGTGNLAIPAARGGAKVVGVDIASNLIQQARQRAAAEGVQVQFEEGDAEQLQFGDGEFDVVVTMFGAMFAPRPERTAQELLRVVRPGGLIAMANWTPQGFVGKFFSMGARYVPPPPGVPSPLLWGKDEVVRELLGKGATKIETRPVMLTFNFPQGPRQVVELFSKYFGPTNVMLSKLDTAGQQQFKDELTELWSKHNEGDENHSIVQAEYLEVRAVKA
jgi:2-polyprenyl-3-methyl-5-hydroxy-6-metoxy-1,4-benzoquinol methylase